MKRKILFAIMIVLITSIFFDILILEISGHKPGWLPYAKLIIILGASIICIFVREYKPFFKYTIVLVTVIATQIVSEFISLSSLWNSIFDANTFVGNFGSGILLKFISIIPVLVVLLITLKSRKEFYLLKGDLSVKAEKIGWLGINKDSISWGKLSFISAMLISVGTILLTMITVTGISPLDRLDELLVFLPIIILFALINSFCEGILFRSTILGTLKTVLPKKYVIIIAALFFGVAHYYGAPSGIIGVVMSGVLGWYMCRSMYETKGFASSWFIHFMQDVAVFLLYTCWEDLFKNNVR